MAAYLIHNVLEVLDPDVWADFRSKVVVQMADHGARIIAVGGEPKVLDGEWNGVRDVIIEFPDMDAVDRWYKSDDYKPLLEMRLASTRGNLIAVDGV